MVRRNAMTDASDNFENSPKYNIISLIVTGAKIIASLIILLTMDHPCWSISEMWIVGMLIHDILYFYTCEMRLKNVYAIHRLQQMQAENSQNLENIIQNHGNGNEANLAEEDVEELYRNILRSSEAQETMYRTTLKVSSRSAKIRVFSQICLW